MKVGTIVRWGNTYLTGRVVEVQGDYALVEIIPDLIVDVDARFRKFFVPGKIVRIHCSSLEEATAEKAA